MKAIVTDSADSGKPYPTIDPAECKACGRCIDSCPKKVLALSDELNERGYRYAFYCGEGCTGCGNCYYACPEPHTIHVHRPGKKT